MTFTSIEELRDKVIFCTDCDLCKTRTNAVPGKGNPKSKILFVGEAPGRSEDKEGAPFVGSAGKILSIALEEAGLERDLVYITNVVKCRPPSNRIPTIDEKKACSKYLESEISLINPEIICIMGNTAFSSLLGGREIMRNRGKLITKNDRNYFVTIHPAATIYDQKLLAVLKTDMKKLAELIKLRT